MSSLPVDDVLPRVVAALSEAGAAVLVAPPGAGKTTRVPLRLLDRSWNAEGRVLMLEPRRLAARAAAFRMAETLGEPPGRTVGYRVRRETRVSAGTRIEVITEGILTRMLQSDPGLDGVAAVIFDEFHERNLHSDLGLALALDARSVLRPDLRILVMSATLDPLPVATLLGGAPVIRSEGRAFPVDLRYRPSPASLPIESSVARVVEEALDSDRGDVLVFLPGEGEIRRSEALLREAIGGSAILAPLYGALSFDDQKRAILPDPGGRRRIVLATSIAETSLTIEGVSIVVDSGLARVPRFSPRTGMSRLETVRVSLASATQRAGRAGRLGPGVCYRLWERDEEPGMLAHAPPEIREADLAPLVLELAVWGARDPAQLRWVDAPPDGAVAAARELLRELECLAADGSVTPHGRRVSAFGAHPRLGHLVLKGVEAGEGPLACSLAALLSSRDLLGRRSGPPDPDLRPRLDVLAGRGRAQSVGSREVEAARAEEREWRTRAGVVGRWDDVSAAGALLLYAYPDRVGVRRGGAGGRYLLRTGRGVTLDSGSALNAERFLVVAEAGDAGTEGRVYLAAPLAEADLLERLVDQIGEERTLVTAPSGRPMVRRRLVLGAIVLGESMSPVDPDSLVEVLAVEARAEGLHRARWSDEGRRLRERIAFLRSIDPGWPDPSDEALVAAIETWLPSALARSGASGLGGVDMAGVLRGLLDWRQTAALDELAPTHFEAPSGSRLPIDYSDPAAPFVAVRLQELFGLRATPRLGRGAVPLIFHLLSPAGRPVQVTRDLESFWARGYFEVRKDLRGRYPKHPWPDDPLSAEPTNRAKRRPT
jgi:ATP-dependent helicase HrpB